jgi:3-deoxy-D-manno-octulosonic-acid transferase
MASSATVTGPHLKDFLWVGEGLFEKNIVCRVKNWQQVADFMIESLVNVRKRSVQKEQAQSFIKAHKGGTKLAVNQITRSLQRRKWNQ